jgi:hypothetical protein
MENLKRKLAFLALGAAVGVIGIASPAGAGAGPNEGGANCHGVVLSYFATSEMAPGQLHKHFDVPAHDVQDQADLLCGP